jgi:hypothetical protein
MGVVLAVALARLRYRPLRWILIAAGVAAAALLPVLTASTSQVTAAEALRHGMAQLDPGQRSLVVSYAAGPRTGAELAALNSEVDGQLSRLSAGRVGRQLLFRRISDGAGGTFYLAATDTVRDAVALTSGRLPSSCTPQRCEVVVVGANPPQLDPALGLVVVGTARRMDPLLLGGTFDPGHDAPLLLADGIAEAAQIEALQGFQRSYGWYAPIDLDRVLALGLDAYLTRSADVADVFARYDTAMTLTAPDDTLRTEADRAARSAGSFALLTAGAGALLLGFAVIGAIGVRRDHAATRELLRRRGASPAQLRVLSTVEAVVPVAAGVLIAVACGAAVAAWRGSQAGLPAVASAGAAVRGSAFAVAVTAALAAFLVAVTIAWPTGTAARTAWRVLDSVVLAGLVVAVVALGRGSVGTASLGAGTDPLLLALPVVFLLCGGLLVGRAWPWLTRGLHRLTPKRRLGVRIGLLTSLRRPLRPVATAAFLAAATGLIAFAGAYQATLRQGAADQAAYAVPFDATLSVGTTLDRPLDVSTMDTFRSMAPGVAATAVLRASGSVKVNAVSSLAVSVVGLDPATLSLIHSYGHVVGSTAPGTSAAAIAATAAADGIGIPAGVDHIAFPVSGSNVDDAKVTCWLRTPDGRETGATLTHSGDLLVAQLPAPLEAPAHLYAFVLVEDPLEATRHQHHTGEGGTDVQVPTGSVVLGPPQLSGASTAAGDWSGWGGEAGATVDATPQRLAIGYRFSGAAVVVHPVRTLPALVALADPDTAAQAAGGQLQVMLNGATPVPVHVAGTLPRFPTTGGHFLVTDAGALAQVLDAQGPGAGEPGEVWVAVPAAEQAQLAARLAQPPYDRLTVALRQSREDALRTDPVATGATGLLTLGAALALAVGLLGLVLLVVAERRDTSGELYTWESAGVGPGQLRRSLLARALATAAVAVPGGVAIGAALAAVTTALVLVTAVGAAPVPPLSLAVRPVWTVAVVAGGLLVALATAGAVAATALRERAPRPPEDSS